jgi:hypothetical protein
MNILEVRSFTSLAGYYMIFICSFLNIAHPITLFQKKGIKCEWNTKCEESFHHLKDLLTSAPIFKVVYSDEDFIVCTYTCKEGLSGVLTQNGHVIFYESRNLNEHEIHCATHDLEFPNIVHSLKM